MSEQLQAYREQVQGLEAKVIVAWAFETFGVKDLVLASSLGAEDQVLTDMVCSQEPEARVFTLDTGRLFQESYNVMQTSMNRYHLKYEVYAPEADEIIDLVRDKGPNLFYDSVMDRKQCCYVRKVRPLQKVLGTAKAWLTGLRSEQSVTRDALEVVEGDDNFGLYKINPLAAWSEADIWSYIKDKDVPYNALHEQGFLSIGCVPCTRVVKDGEDVRAGRWWWEDPKHKECGLHAKK